MTRFCAWRQTESEILAQGDVLRDVEIPLLTRDWTTSEDLAIAPSLLIVLSQSCDLEPSNNGVRAKNVMCCPMHTIPDWELKNPKTVGQWKSIAQGKVAGVHLVPPFVSVAPRESWVCDFRSPTSLPYDYLMDIFQTKGFSRWRLQSPFVEALSSTFGDLFARVALPTSPLSAPRW